MSESDVRVVFDVSDSIHVSKWDYRKHGFMSLSGNAGRSRHGVGSREDAAGPPRQAGGITGKEHRPQAGVPAPPDKKNLKFRLTNIGRRRSPAYIIRTPFLCLTPPSPLRAARPWQWSIR